MVYRERGAPRTQPSVRHDPVTLLRVGSCRFVFGRAHPEIRAILEVDALRALNIC